MPPRPGQAVALLIAAAVGVGASQALAERRSTGPEDPGGALSLEVDRSEPTAAELAPGPDDGLTVTLPVLLRNSGPQAVVLEDVELDGTMLRDDAVAGRRLPSGATSRLTLRRSVDCAQEEDVETPRLPGPLTITATTTAGERTIALRLDDAARSVAEMGRRACGRLPPGQALTLETISARVDNGVGRLGLDVRNDSAQPLQVRDVVPAEGLRVWLRDSATGAEVVLPLDIPAGGYDGPGRSADRMPPLLRLTAVFVVDDCGSPLPGSAFPGGPVFQLVVAAGGQGSAGRTEMAGFGDAGSLIGEMEAETCP